MSYEMRIATMLADQVDGFIQFVQENYDHKHKSYVENPDKLYQVKLLIDEYKFQLNAAELRRINRFSWNEKYTYLLVEDVKKGLGVIEEYVKRNYNDLFILTGRLHTLRSLCSSFQLLPK
ncbi:hypothetical protein E1I69_09265 [Bacillus timonensis]|uniref:Uncharacterized protein n=1 Tax=Bacillus timonensis TaxID=1033734 RepID=A0A4S3PTJ9_9BACI|nr:hypothetical protein [Bacillus timonensis]THE13049.1 hypothetical protein E1I69_09265 [Bacillus timonensis]